MRVAIHQPNFLPRLKVLQKLAAADCWVVLDNVQYVQREWQNRAWVVPPAGKGFWVSLPVRRPLGRATRIDQTVVLNPIRTEHKTAASLLHCFRRAPFWPLVRYCTDHMAAAFESTSLVDICIASTLSILALCGNAPKVIRASELAVTGRRSKLMARICDELGADYYLADSGAKSYLRDADFTSTQVLWQEWAEPVARWDRIRRWRNMSSVNFLAWEGPLRLRSHLADGVFVVDGREVRSSSKSRGSSE